MDDGRKGMRYAASLIDKAKKERDTKGYRENLGYDSYNKLRSKLSNLDLSYATQSRILTWFNTECDKI